MEEKYNASIKANDIIEILGPARLNRDKYENNDVAGVVTGLAWTQVGGDILFIESILSKGKGTLSITGNLGKVMKESATIALEYIKANADIFNIKPEVFTDYNIHIHVPEGATPKDGPSAGITMLTSLISLLTQRKVKKNLAMTVEITGIKRREVDVILKDDLLKIRMFVDNIWDNNNTKVTVYYKQIEKIDANEGARIIAKDVIKSRDLDIRAQEGGKVIGKVDANFVYGKAVTGGEIDLEGEAREQEIVINSGGQYYASELESNEVQVRVSAGGTAEVFARKYIKANTNAGGTIRIFGNPTEMDTQKLLGGKIIEVN